MSELNLAHDYAIYIWSAYAIFVGGLIIDACAPLLHKRQIVAQLRSLYQRERSRRSAK